MSYEPVGVGRGGSVCGPGVAGAGVVYEVQGGVGGCVGLVSGGVSGEESAFLDASGSGPGGEEGEDVFFLTAGAARRGIDGAYDYRRPPVQRKGPLRDGDSERPPACSDTDSCRAAPAPQPAIYGAPSSATFNGAGNPAPDNYPRGQIKHKTANKRAKARSGPENLQTRARQAQAAGVREGRKETLRARRVDRSRLSELIGRAPPIIWAAWRLPAARTRARGSWTWRTAGPRRRRSSSTTPTSST